MRTKSDSQLSLEQLRAVDLLLTGQSDHAVAEVVGVTRQTICGWRNGNAAFAAELNKRRAEAWSQSVDRLRALVGDAIEVIGAGLKDPDPQLRQRAATTILKTVGLSGLPPPGGPLTPEGVEREQLFAALND